MIVRYPARYLWHMMPDITPSNKQFFLQYVDRYLPFKNPWAQVISGNFAPCGYNARYRQIEPDDAIMHQPFIFSRWPKNE